MFKKLRNRMMLLNIGVVALVMITIVFLISYTSVSILRRQAEDIKTKIEKYGFYIEKKSEDVKETPVLGNKMIVIPIDAEGNLTTIANSPRMADEGTRQTLYEIIDEDFPDGRYIKSDEREFFTFNIEQDGLKIYFFIDATQERELNKQIIENTLFIGLSAMVLIILASIFLTNRALVPVKQAWEKQKQFVSDASHELRTPLSIIQTNMEVIGSDDQATVKSQKKWVGNINFEVSRMSKLIENLLFLSRKDKNETFKTEQRICIDEVIKKIIDNLNDVAIKKDLQLKTNLEDTPVNIPDVELERMAVILIENAIKYTDEGVINVKTFSDDGHCMLEVSDTGSGLTEDDMNHIFERFYRVDSDRSRKSGGYGLGLSIAKSIAESYNGTIEVTSQIDVGSTFTVRLPSAKSK